MSLVKWKKAVAMISPRPQFDTFSGTSFDHPLALLHTSMKHRAATALTGRFGRGSAGCCSASRDRPFQTLTRLDQRHPTTRSKLRSPNRWRSSTTKIDRGTVHHPEVCDEPLRFGVLARLPRLPAVPLRPQARSCRADWRGRAFAVPPVVLGLLGPLRRCRTRHRSLANNRFRLTCYRNRNTCSSVLWTRRRRRLTTWMKVRCTTSLTDTTAKTTLTTLNEHAKIRCRFQCQFVKRIHRYERANAIGVRAFPHPRIRPLSRIFIVCNFGGITEFSSE